MMVISLVGAYITEDDFLTLHVAFGYSAGILIIFRLIWGLIGPKYSHFSDFPMGIKSIVGFIQKMGKSGNVCAGHNPLASLVMLGIMFMVILVALTGTLALNQEGGQGLLKSFTLPIGIKFKEIHEVCVQILIGLTILHLLGLIADLIMHKSPGVLRSIFTGYKSGVEAEDSKMNGFQKLFSAVWIVAPLFAFYTTFTGPPVQLENEDKENGSNEMYQEDEEVDD
jgi:cytochrome b